MSKYQLLANYRRLSGDEADLSFTEIEEIIERALPDSARRHPAWWANSRTADSHSWAHLWLKAGWETNGINLIDEIAHFRRVEYFEIESQKAREGYEIDRTLLARGRNSTLAEQRKQLDNYTCQACGFRLQLESRWVIEAHHLNPLGASGETETRIEQLVSLCPTCHRIAHLRSTPFTPEEIRELRETPAVAERSQ